MSPPPNPHAPAVEDARWFAEEVQPYEAALRAYLHGRFPSLPDQDDIVQDTYARLLRARAAGWPRQTSSRYSTRCGSIGTRGPGTPAQMKMGFPSSTHLA